MKYYLFFHKILFIHLILLFFIDFSYFILILLILADKDVLNDINYVKGGPSSYAIAGNSKNFPNIINHSLKTIQLNETIENENEILITKNNNNNISNKYQMDNGELLDNGLKQKKRFEFIEKDMLPLTYHKNDLHSTLKKVMYDLTMNESLVK